MTYQGSRVIWFHNLFSDSTRRQLLQWVHGVEQPREGAGTVAQGGDNMADQAWCGVCDLLKEEVTHRHMTAAPSNCLNGLGSGKEATREAVSETVSIHLTAIVLITALMTAHLCSEVLRTVSLTAY